MTGRLHAARVGVVVVACLVCGSTASAQAPDRPSGPPPVSVGGEVSATISPEDRGFFTYTDYDQDLLRQVRVRLTGEWKPLRPLSFVGEVRTLNVDRVEAAAWYARWAPWADRDFAVQVGRIPPVIGAFARRAYGRDNPLLSIPLAYGYLTSLRPDALPASTDDLIVMRGRGWRPSYPIGSTEVDAGIPLIASTNWNSGAEVYWRHGWIEAAGAWTLGSPAAPAVFSLTRGHQVSGRLGLTGAGFTGGVSAARGQWVDDEVLDLAGAEAHSRESQTIVGVDGEYGHGPWLVRAEWLRSVFEIPLRESPATSALPAWSAFTDVRYRIGPRWQVAGRLERLAFGTIPGTAVPIERSWDANVTRTEGVVSYRVTRRLEVRGGWLQHWRNGGLIRRRGAPAASVLFWF